MTAILPGVFNAQFFTDSGALAAGYRLYTYVPGTTTHRTIYTDAAGAVAHTYVSDGAGGQYIALNARGELPSPPFIDESVDFCLKTAAGATVWTRRAPVQDSSSPLAESLAGLGANDGAGAIGWSASTSYAVQTIGGAVSQAEPQMIWWITSDAERTAIKAGTSTTDHTSLIQGAMSLMGARGLQCGAKGWRWNISGTLTMASGATYSGKATIKCIAGSGVAHMMYGAATVRTTVADLELDGNVDSSGTMVGHGIFFDTGGTANAAIGVYVHDTFLAGIRGEQQDDLKILFGRYINCGRTGASDNHGIMCGLKPATTAGMSGGLVVGNEVTGAFRKGIALYAFGSGIFSGMRIAANRVSGCGLGGIYIAGDAANDNLQHIQVTANQAWDNYVNYELATSRYIQADGNDSWFTNVAGKFAGWAIAGLRNSIITGGTVDYSPQHGMWFAIGGSTANDDVTVRDVKVTRSNQLNLSTGAGVYLSDSVNCRIDVDVTDTTGKATHCVLEYTGCDNNVIEGTATGFTTARYLVTGANTSIKKIERAYALTYSASVTPNNYNGTTQVLSVTNTSSFTLNAIGEPIKGQRVTLKIKNASGGSLGTVTWDANYKMASWTSPANGYSRSITFECDGTYWVEVSRTTADIPN